MSWEFIVRNVLRAFRRRNVQALAAAAIIAGGGAIAAVVPAVSASATAVVPECTTAHLAVWMGVPGDGIGTYVHYPLELTNLSSTCTLKGYPRVTAVGPGGTQLGSPASIIGNTLPPITLAQGATAYVNLQFTNPAAFNPTTCKKVNAIGLRVYPPNTTASTIVRFPFAACSKKGPDFLDEAVIRAGLGIPGVNV
jgi:hypothetical protein